ncbi:MAG: hypothetical protein IKR85_11095 [Clostridia bacterium]|nr:hypothetical protein [Clostridia bacterium]
MKKLLCLCFALLFCAFAAFGEIHLTERADTFANALLIPDADGAAALSQKAVAALKPGYEYYGFRSGGDDTVYCVFINTDETAKCGIACLQLADGVSVTHYEFAGAGKYLKPLELMYSQSGERGCVLCEINDGAAAAYVLVPFEQFWGSVVNQDMFMLVSASTGSVAFSRQEDYFSVYGYADERTSGLIESVNSGDILNPAEAVISYDGARLLALSDDKVFIIDLFEESAQEITLPYTENGEVLNAGFDEHGDVCFTDDDGNSLEPENSEPDTAENELFGDLPEWS